MRANDKRLLALLTALELKELRLLPKALFYAIVNTPFVFAKRPVVITAMTIIIWGSIAATFISLDRLGGIADPDALFGVIMGGLFLHGLFLFIWCSSPDSIRSWHYGKSFAKDAAKFSSKKDKIRRRILRPARKQKD
ncbi:MAG: hypothetical protein ACYTAS_09585 [Planctomycetota bacterium]|jgi:hypothetical protein